MPNTGYEQKSADSADSTDNHPNIDPCSIVAIGVDNIAFHFHLFSRHRQRVQEGEQNMIYD